MKQDLFHRWVDAVSNNKLRTLPKMQVYKNYYICHLHFQSKDIVVRTRRGLRANAVPVLLLPKTGTKITYIYFNTMQSIIHLQFICNFSINYILRFYVEFMFVCWVMRLLFYYLCYNVFLFQKTINITLSTLIICCFIKNLNLKY